MPKLALYDPPMCCSTGVCGPVVDPTLPRVSADLDWLKRQGIQVERYNLAQQPQAFASNPVVTAALRKHGNDCLPLVLVDGEVVSRGTYPDRSELARLAGLGAAAEAETPKEAASSCCSSPGVVAIGGAARSSGKCC
jgi:arsenite methyltransferase